MASTFFVSRKWKIERRNNKKREEKEKGERREAEDKSVSLFSNMNKENKDIELLCESQINMNKSSSDEHSI